MERIGSRGPTLMRDLEQLKAVDITLDGCRYWLRTDLVGATSEVFASAGVRPPHAVCRLDDNLATCRA
jgi:hypothetical protein